MRTCGPDKSTKNDRKTQINIEICDFVQSQNVCVCGGGGGGEEGHQIFCTPTAK